MVNRIISAFIFIIAFILSCDTTDQNNHRPGKSLTAFDRSITDHTNFFRDSDVLSSATPFLTSFAWIESVVLTDSGNAFILDSNCKITKLNTDGKILFTIESLGQGPGEMLRAKKLVYRNSKLYILDQSNNKILLYDTNGRWIKDVTIKDLTILSFAVDSNGNIIIPFVLPKSAFKKQKLYKQDIPLFKAFNENGELISNISNLRYVVDECTMDSIFNLILCCTPENNIIVGFRTSGNFFLFNERGELLNRFTIQKSPEWKASVKEERMFEKYSQYGEHNPIRIQDVSLGLNDHIFVTFTGHFQNMFTICMIYNSAGEFLGRLYDSKYQQYPNCLAVENDTTVWIYYYGKEFLGKCKMAYRVEVQ